MELWTTYTDLSHIKFDCIDPETRNISGFYVSCIAYSKRKPWYHFWLADMSFPRENVFFDKNVDACVCVCTCAFVCMCVRTKKMCVRVCASVSHPYMNFFWHAICQNRIDRSILTIFCKYFYA